MTSETHRHAVETTIAAAGSKATYTGASMSIVGWMLTSEFAVLFGMILGLAGFLVNWHYKRKLTNEEIKLRREWAARERAEHELRMKAMK